MAWSTQSPLLERKLAARIGRPTATAAVGAPVAMAVLMGMAGQLVSEEVKTSANLRACLDFAFV